MIARASCSDSRINIRVWIAFALCSGITMIDTVDAVEGRAALARARRFVVAMQTSVARPA
ncbi:MAG TPA: hypothetical protein VIW45_18925 [Vicinamibacterales bacterium]